MEELIGALWHRTVTRMADTRYPHAAVSLVQMRSTLGIFFRALGGDAGLQIEAADATTNASVRSWLQRLAGTNTRTELAWRDERALRLPPRIACFDQPDLNRDLYLWLAALAAVFDQQADGSHDWFQVNQQATQCVLLRFPGLGSRYRRLVRAHLAQRPDPAALAREDAAAECALRQALTDPGSIAALPPVRRPLQPVPLWCHPDPPVQTARNSVQDDADMQQHAADLRELDDVGRRAAEPVDESDSHRGLVTVRMENIFTMGEFVNVDRGSEEEEDVERAEAVANELDRLAISRNGKAAMARLKFDLDLPATAADDHALDDGLLLPEWDWKKRVLLPDRCRVVTLKSRNARPCSLPPRLSRTARKLRGQFQALAPAKVWRRAQADGQDVDLDAYLRFVADRKAGHAVAPGNLYRDLRSGDRNLSCLLLADLSLSTDTWIDDAHRVIDVIRDSLFLFAECLHATGDRFSLYGFSTRKRDPIRVNVIKRFDEPYGSSIRGRIDAIRPGYYTRLGAGIRYASQQLANEGCGKRLLLVLTDGKPNDLDQYEGRYGIEDTRQAVTAARQAGLIPFCVTIDRKGNDYLPHIFGQGDYVVIHDPRRLPGELPRLYARLTQ